MDSAVEARLEKITPLIRQYQSIKRGVGDAILFFRLGDFYEMFNEDAVTASKLLGILLTKKSAGVGNSVPLAGVPVHSADTYIARLVRAGKKVAICEQVAADDPSKSKGIMDRAVVRIVTPGTLVEENLLPPQSESFLGAVARVDGCVGLACVDVSTGDFQVGEWPSESDAFKNTFDLLPLQELIQSDSAPELFGRSIPISRRPPPDVSDTIASLGKRFGAGAVEVSGLTRSPAALQAAGLALEYLSETRSDQIPLRLPRFFSSDGVMELDAPTIRNLEILSNLSGDARAGLVHPIDRTRTAMGARLIRRWLLAPLRRAADISDRQSAIQALVDFPDTLDALRSALGQIGDLDRILSRLARVATARVADLVTLRNSVETVPAVISELSKLDVFSEDASVLPDLSGLRELLRGRLADMPSASIGEGTVIRAGVHAELDELRSMLENQRLHLLKFQDLERSRSGIASLKVSYNKIYGYYIEISKANLESVPADYIRKQTLVNAERFITPDLKQFEEKLLAASDRIASIERELFNALLSEVLAHSEKVRAVSAFVARVDVLSSLAEVARRERWVRPVLAEEDVLEIRDGRHPVVEKFCADAFVPNDTILSADRRVAIVTGPNMAGKSTFIRQTAVLTLLAQIGSFVPAKSMRWRPVDRVFTRIGASDDLSRGQSTFYVEMSETAAILRQATRESLILLDEIGRGTSTYDGLSIAWSVAEHIAETIRAKTLFATHYHELADLSGRSGIHTLTVLVREWEGQVVFLRKVKDGASDRSFGIAVADLAGIPKPVLDRARRILTDLESGSAASPARRPEKNNQSDLFASTAGTELEELKLRIAQLKLDRMTPLEVMAEVSTWQKDLA